MTKRTSSDASSRGHANASAAAATSSARKSVSARKTRTNKHGQALGRKGGETRQRLMDAARSLLQEHSPLTLTAVSVAKEAGTSSATFYIYFDDVREIMLALSIAASGDLGEVHRILEEDWDTGTVGVEHTQRVVDAFFEVWNRHRDVLRFRNLEADRGDPDFLDLRIRSSISIIDRFVDHILAAYPRDQRPPRGEAYAEATTLYAALEGLAETDPSVVDEWRIGTRRLAQAAARLIARSFGILPTETRTAPVQTPAADNDSNNGNAKAMPAKRPAAPAKRAKRPAKQTSASKPKSD